MDPSSVTAHPRPPFARQSMSDGPSSSALGQPDAHNAHFPNGQRGSFSGLPHLNHPTQTAPSFNHLTSNGSHHLPTPPAQSSPSSAQQPSTGPLSASDPRTQLLVSNLPYRVRWQDLKDLFRKAGTVLRADVSLSPDNRSRGYGTVLMATEEDAINAADMLGGFTWQGRTLEVRVDRSGTLVGVAGSAATLGQSAGATHPNSGLGSHATSANSSYLNLPQMNLPGMRSPSPSLGRMSPSLSSSVSSAHSPGHDRRNSPFASIDDLTGASSNDGLSDFERGFMQGQLRGAGLQNPTQSQNKAYTFASSSSAHRSNNSPFNIQAGWSAGLNDPAAAQRYNPTSSGSSVPTGVPGVAAMAPWPGAPGTMGAANGLNVQSQPYLGQPLPTGTPTTSYAGRVLFVGNLPFHCQWQDLKDLFRAAGNIQRADVAIGPEGRSRGFGTVLFATQEDAQNAVRLYHGYEYSGRTLKVHFDRFAAQNGPAIGTPGAPSQYTGAFAAAQPPAHVSNNNRPAGYPTQAAHPHHQQHHQQQHPHLHPASAQAQAQLPHQAQLHSLGSAALFNQVNAQASSNSPAGLQPQSFSALGSAVGSNLRQQNTLLGIGNGSFDLQYQQQPIQNTGQHQLRTPSLSSQQQHHQHHHPNLHQHANPYSPQPHALQSHHLQQNQAAQSQGNVFAEDSNQFISQQTSSHLPHHRQQAHSQSDSQSSHSQSLQPSPSLSHPHSRQASGDAKQASPASQHSQPTNDEMQPNLKQNPMTIALPTNSGFSGAGAYLPSDLMSPGLVSPFVQPDGQIAAGGSRPGRIQLPPLGFGVESGQASPMTARMSVPMTPGMPGFTFQAVPQTPPLYPQFLSPGLGPFSPPLGTPHAVPSMANITAAAGFPGFINAAPGAPLHASNTAASGRVGSFNPLFPDNTSFGQGGSQAQAAASLAHYDQQPQHQQQQAMLPQQPATPHWSQSYQPQRGSHRSSFNSGYDDAENGDANGHSLNDGEEHSVSRSDIARTPGAMPRRPPAAADQGATSPHQSHPTLARRASDGTPGPQTTPPAADGYPFPLVGNAVSSLIARRASTNSPATSPMPHGPGSRRESRDAGAGTEQLPGGLNVDVISASSAEELAKTIARLSVKGTALAKDPNAKRSLSMTAERTAAASAMARLRERAESPVPPGATQAFSSADETGSQNCSVSASNGGAAGPLGAPFGDAFGADATAGAGATMSSPLKARLGLQGLSQPGKPSPLSTSQFAAQSPGSSASPGTPLTSGAARALEEQAHASTESQSFRAARDSLLGVSVSSSDVEAAKSGSALDTGTPDGSLHSTPAEETGPSQ